MLGEDSGPLLAPMGRVWLDSDFLSVSDRHLASDSLACNWVVIRVAGQLKQEQHLGASQPGLPILQVSLHTFSYTRGVLAPLG